jgi:hypothetical protein
MITRKPLARPGLMIGILIISALIMTVSCKTEEVPGQWVPKDMTIDGKMTEWDSMPGLYFEESRTLMEFCNDSENLYVMVRFSNPMWVQTIRMSGLTLWLDAEGKKNKTVGIRYNGAPGPEEMQKMGFGGGMQGRMGQNMPTVPEGITQQEQFLFLNESNPEGILMPTGGSKGPAVAYSVVDGFCIYEISIPMSAGVSDILGLNLEPGQKYTIGAVWGDMGDFKAKMDKSGGPPGGGRGGMGGGRAGGMGGRRPSMPEKQEVWIMTDFAAPEVVENRENEVF